MVHKFLNQCNIPWVHLIWESYYQNSLPPGENAQCSFWWKDCLKLLDTYKLHSSCTPGSGKSILFWKDNWAGNTLNSQWPQLASFALNPHMSLHQIINTEDTSSLFHLPFSVEAFEQYQEMLGLLQNFPILDQNDTWRFPSGVTSYAVSNTYIILMGEFHTIPAISWLWKANCS
uniref:Reverse transcriptase zinc-binding domain-containing protein n=1 Tax=Aegilops tauschii subsp. strangulata TaxID=200361 RepID=A0A452XUB9_AEGTS